MRRMLRVGMSACSLPRMADKATRFLDGKCCQLIDAIAPTWLRRVAWDMRDVHFTVDNAA